MGDIRDKYKNKSMRVKDLKKQVDNEDNIVGSAGISDFLKIKEDGKTVKIRLFPAHDGKEFIVLRKQHWISIEGEGDKPSRRTVLNAFVHGGKKEDIIDAYIKYATANLKDKEKIAKLTSYEGGLTGQNEWIGYAVKITADGTEFGKVEFKKTVRDAINAATFVEDEDEPIEIDPWTDIDEGLPLLIKYLSKPNKKKGENYYSVTAGKKAIPMTDEDITKFDKAKPLTDLYSNVYTSSMFELALEGLKYFDVENEIELFEDEDWLEIVKQIKSQFDDKSVKKSSKKQIEEDEEEDEPVVKKKVVKKVDEEDEEEEEEEEKPKKKLDKNIIEEDEDDDDEEEEPKKKLSMEDIRKRLKNK